MSHPASSSPSTPPSGTPPPLGWDVLRARLDATGVLAGVHAGSEAPNRLPVPHLTDDSRRVRDGSAFVAVPGTDVDGHAFIEAAIRQGARLVVCESRPEKATARFPHVVFVEVTNTRIALAEGAAAIHGDPAQELHMVGVTGTNGKTTVAYLVHHLLDALGDPCGLISTIEVRTGTMAANAALTTPGPLELQRTLRHMRDEACTACAMEVSSHALDQARVHGIEYDTAIFTNLTTDHLDYHGTLGRYRAAKKMLFDELGAGATAIVNADDSDASAMTADTNATVVTYGLTNDADVAVDLLDSTGSLRLRIDGRERSFRLAGRFNAYNLAAAYAAGRAAGYAPDAVLDVLAEAPPVPGRFEQLQFDDGTTVVVDYAHTSDALENILRAVRDTTPADAALWCVFGCGGDRDASKRRVMGSVAEHYADRVIVTSDNPRTEDPGSILNDVRRGMSRPADAQWIVDREAAIRTAAEQAAPGDVVLIAGKGHETYQVIGTDKRPFDDRAVARRYFTRRTPA